jgi:putative membrane protein
MSLLKSVLPPDPRRSGKDPDYRFTFANERTFLAWIRTSLALTAGGLGAIHLLPDLFGREAIGVVLLALGFVTAASAYRRWALAETAMRTQSALPESRLPQLLTAGVAVVGLLAAVLLVVERAT